MACTVTNVRAVCVASCALCPHLGASSRPRTWQVLLHDKDWQWLAVYVNATKSSSAVLNVGVRGTGALYLSCLPPKSPCHPQLVAVFLRNVIAVWVCAITVTFLHRGSSRLTPLGLPTCSCTPAPRLNRYIRTSLLQR